jgi:CheY-like chemotaxis protein
METQTAAPEAAAAVPLGPATIVYIEDNDSNVLLMQRMLARRPQVSLVHVARGGEGAAVVASRQPQLVMLDMHLPDMSGHDVLRRIRADPRCRHIPVIVLSADATPGLPKRLEAAGARGFLSKPLNVRQALNAIDALLAERQGAQP